MTDRELVEAGSGVIRREAGVLGDLAASLGDGFAEVARRIDACEGKVAFVGMGKPGRVNGKVAATFCSLGIPAFVLHPGEAMHGDLGVLQRGDLAVVVSYSGESDEVTTILPLVRRYAGGVVAVTGNERSTLARSADVTLVFPRFQEADGLGLAPTSSTTAWLALADALAVAVSQSRGFAPEDFGGFHPAGSLGKKLLLTVDDLMAAGEDNALVDWHAPLSDAIGVMAAKGLGAVCVRAVDGTLAGIVTDGDLRRLLASHANVYGLNVEYAMTPDPISVAAGAKAADALALMRVRDVSCLPVVDEEKRPVGTVLLKAIVDAGIVPER